ncbi:MAG: ABC transporter ATP-binding protein [Bifidobacterium sp.]|jgi:ABC-type multidrug transport system ATPase subunit|nr:ABC transporter ATP-binding protein [Bifidobacterium sp.]
MTNSFNTIDHQTIIAVHDLSFGYKKGMSVLEHVDFTVPQGQSLAILGVNGAGKSTLLQLIVGLLRPCSGQSVINQSLVSSISTVFLMTEGENMVPKLTIRENIHLHQLAFQTRRESQNDDKDSVSIDTAPVITAFDLASHLDTVVADLSSGLRRRAGIAIGMLFNPDVVLLDEPTNSVDPTTRELLVDFSRQLRSTGHTLITVTHDLDYTWRTAERILILDRKRIISDRMLTEFPNFKSFTEATSFGREQHDINFGIHPV